MTGCQGTPWSEGLDGKELHGELGGEYDLEPRGSSFLLYMESTQPFRASTNVILCLLQKGRCFRVPDTWLCIFLAIQ